MELVNNLVKFGMSEKEAKTYLACLEIGESLAGDISLKSKLPRTLTYDLLERLIQIGLISYVKKENKKYFSAVEPRELIRILAEKERSIKEVLPELEKLNKFPGILKPKVEVFEGKEGMKAVMENILRSGEKEFFGYGSSRSSFEIIPGFMEGWHKRRIKQNMVMNAIYNSTKDTLNKLKNLSSLKLSNFKVSSIKLESPTATVIYGDFVVLQSWTKEPFSVVIKNREMAENQKEYFKKLWKISKRV
ncbi:MAG: hypothetical protein KC516_02820 [Nanoarchaeota archaeon]|nr:hypothetical protein [Nanoarchaeota archaeon]